MKFKIDDLIVLKQQSEKSKRLLGNYPIDKVGKKHIIKQAYLLYKGTEDEVYQYWVQDPKNNLRGCWCTEHDLNLQKDNNTKWF